MEEKEAQMTKLQRLKMELEDKELELVYAIDSLRAVLAGGRGDIRRADERVAKLQKETARLKRSILRISENGASSPAAKTAPASQARLSFTKEACRGG